MNTVLKKITPSAVLMAATTLILAEGCTTVLMVQQFLRHRGYTARKADVASCLHQIAHEQSWLIDENVLFRVYYFPTITASVQ